MRAPPKTSELVKMAFDSCIRGNATIQSIIKTCSKKYGFFSIRDYVNCSERFSQEIDLFKQSEACKKLSGSAYHEIKEAVGTYIENLGDGKLANFIIDTYKLPNVIGMIRDQGLSTKREQAIAFLTEKFNPAKKEDEDVDAKAEDVDAKAEGASAATLKK